GPIEQVALQIDDAGGGHERWVHLATTELWADAEEGVHGALPVRGHEHEAAAGGLASLDGRRGGEGDACGADVMAEDAAELVVCGLADEAGTATKRSDTDDGVGARATGNLNRRAHDVIELRRGRCVHKLHAALGVAMPRQEGVIAASDNVDDGV